MGRPGGPGDLKTAREDPQTFVSLSAPPGLASGLASSSLSRPGLGTMAGYGLGALDRILKTLKTLGIFEFRIFARFVSFSIL